MKKTLYFTFALLFSYNSYVFSSSDSDDDYNDTIPARVIRADNKTDETAQRLKSFLAFHEEQILHFPPLKEITEIFDLNDFVLDELHKNPQATNNQIEYHFIQASAQAIINSPVYLKSLGTKDQYFFRLVEDLHPVINCFVTQVPTAEHR